MKTILSRLLWLCCALPLTETTFSQANTALSNLAVTAVNADLLPSTDNTRSFGSATKGWKTIYLSSAVYMGGSKFVSFGSSITLRNTAVGYNALNLNSSGTFNTAYGASALQNNTSGFGNVAIGYSALYANTSGSSNIAIGIRCLNSNVVSKSLIAIGDSAMFKTNGGQGFNIAIGAKALYSNTTGDHNTAIGSASFFKNTTGRNNVGIGSSALYNNTGGAENNALGHAALLLNTTGSSNIAIGAFAMNNNTSGYSNIAIGSRALNNSRAISGQIAIGDSALYSSNVSTEGNIAIGSKALYLNTTGTALTALGYQALYKNSTASYNTGIGFKTLISNTTGASNTGTGAYALGFNSTGSTNTAIGSSAMYFNSTGSDNTAVGAHALSANSTGGQNTAVGSSALTSNGEGGIYNAALGFNALNENTGGYYNTAIGAAAMTGNATGYSNTSVGAFSLQAVGTGSGNSAFGISAMSLHECETSSAFGAYAGYNNRGTNNTFLGSSADANGATFSNSTAIGYAAAVNSSNIIQLGNSSTQAVISAGQNMLASDGRFKKNIKKNVPGLEFVKLLSPVTYNYDIHALDLKVRSGMRKPVTTSKDQGKEGARKAIDEQAMKAKEKISYTGFVAQEVELAANKIHYDFAGVHKPQSENDIYALSYSDFVVPLVKAVQELSDSNDVKTAKIDSVTAVIGAQNEKIDSLEARLQRIEALLQAPNILGISLTDAHLEQNVPNPARGTTAIAYTLPQNYGRAKILITDMSGKVVQTVNVTGKGRGVLNLNAGSLASGSYPYALYIDDHIVGAKQMLLIK